MSEALDKLIEAVEDGTFLMDVFPDGRTERIAYEAFSGSIDAAKALHEALLPRPWSCILTVLPRAGAADLHWRGNMEPAFTGISANPARAWLIAILRAYLAAQREA